MSVILNGKVEKDLIEKIYIKRIFVFVLRIYIELLFFCDNVTLKKIWIILKIGLRLFFKTCIILNFN